MTVSPIRRRKARTVQFPLGSTPAGHADGGFEATLVMTPGGEPRVRLTQMAWGEGVGWYAQQTLDLDLDEAHQIAALLSRAPKGQQSAPGGLLDTALAQTTELRPIDFAEARARRAGNAQSAPSPTNGAGRAPTPISGCDRAAPASDEAATL